jgi:hypothetical protein
MKRSHAISLAVLLIQAAVGFAQAPPPAYDGEDCFTTKHCWFSPEYLYWRPKSPQLALPLVTSSTSGGAGLPGDEDTITVIGRASLDPIPKFRSGMRFSAGCCDTASGLFVEGSVFGLEESDTERTVASDGTTVLARPFFNSADGGSPSVFLVAFPGAFAGDVTVTTYLRFRGASGHFGCQLCENDCCAVDFLVGGCFLQLNEKFGIIDRTTALQDGLGFFLGQEVATGDIRVRNDRFEGRNEFYGPQIGIRAEACCGPLVFKVKGLLAAGRSVSELNVTGDSSLVQGGVVTATTPGGLLALSSNSGRFRHDEVVLVPQVELSIGLEVCETVRVFAGYSFIWWRDVVRAAEQIPTQINPSFVPTSPNFGAGGLAAPFPSGDTSSFYVHGLNAGIAVRF